MLQVTKENAQKAYDNGGRKERRLLENLYGPEVFSKEITERVKTFDDACAVLGLSVGEVLGLCDTWDEAAYKKLKVIARALNEGWTPDWTNSSQHKYYPWFNSFKSGSGFSDDVYGYALASTYVGSRLCFKTRELAEYAGKQFIDIYNDFLTL